MLRILCNPLVGVCAVVIGAFLIYAGYSNAAKFAALRDHGKTAKAEVTNLEWKEKKITHGDSAYIAHVRFSTEDGREIQAEMGIPATLGQALRSGSVPQSITIHYLPESPSTIEDVTKEDSSDAQKGIGKYLLIAGLAMLALSQFIPRPQVR
jgi:hypothetical protein